MKRVQLLIIVMSCMVAGLLFSYPSLITSTDIAGTLTYDTENGGIFLVTLDGIEKVNLSFANDDENDLIVSDFGKVMVSGTYYSLFDVLRVDEINEYTELPVLCYMEHIN